MANIKLKDHYWETEGIYDAALSKTQKAINADIAEVAQNNSDLVILSDTQPTATGNKIWIKEGVSYQIPVMDDLISNNITNNSTVTGAKVTDALNTLSTDVSGLQGSLNAINKPSKTRKFVIISDSYGIGVTAGGTTTGWIERFREYLGLTTNTNLFSSAVGGSGFIGGTGVATFNDQLNTVYGNISSVADTITDVIFAGGYNDRGYYSTTLPSAIQTTVDNTKTKFPNAKIWVFSIGYYTGGDTDLPRNQLLNTNSVYCTEAIRKGATYANISKVLKMSASWMSSDSIHPTTAGYQEIGANIADFVQGGNIRATYDEQTVIAVPVGNITLHGTNSDKLFMRALNDNIVFYDNKILLDRFQFPAGTLITQAYNDICTLSNSLIHGVSNLSYFPVTGFMYKAGYKEFQGFLRISNNILSLLIRNIENGAYEDLSTVTRLTIDFFGIKTPIDCC